MLFSLVAPLAAIRFALREVMPRSSDLINRRESPEPAAAHWVQTQEWRIVLLGDRARKAGCNECIQIELREPSWAWWSSAGSARGMLSLARLPRRGADKTCLATGDR